MKPEQIKEWCDLTLKGGMEPDNDLEVKIASKWCMEYKTIKDNFPKNKELITEASEFKSKYQGLQDGELKKSIDAVDLKESLNSGEEKFKKWCADNSNRTASERNKFFIDNISTHCLKDKKGK